MKINKQLFEDVLSGKLKGMFVLRNKQIVKSNILKRSTSDIFPYEILIKYDNGISDYGTFKSNGDFESYSTSRFDIIDFIPNTNMKENELAIEIPNGKIVDWDESKKQNKIVLKDKQLTYGDICEKLFKDWAYFIDQRGDVCSGHTYCITDSNNATTKHQLECILAKNKLANVAKYLNNGWKPTDATRGFGYFIFRNVSYDTFHTKECDNYKYDSNVVFKTTELAYKAIEILGEETVKLALEPLGI